MFHIVIFTLFAASTAQYTNLPPRFTLYQTDSQVGSYDSHQEYLKQNYKNGTRNTYVIKPRDFPSGSILRVAVDVTSRARFCLRGYDFGVIYNCEDANLIRTPCDVPSYTALGRKDIDYLSLTMANTAALRVFYARNMAACMDVCINDYDSTYTDSGSCMTGFRAIWMVVNNPSPTCPPTTNPTTPNPTGSSQQPTTPPTPPPTNNPTGSSQQPTTPPTPPPTGSSQPSNPPTATTPGTPPPTGTSSQPTNPPGTSPSTNPTGSSNAPPSPPPSTAPPATTPPPTAPPPTTTLGPSPPPVTEFFVRPGSTTTRRAG